MNKSPNACTSLSLRNAIYLSNRLYTWTQLNLIQSLMKSSICLVILSSIALLSHLKSTSAQPKIKVCYTAHVQNRGWQPEVCDGAVAGTTGQGLQIEAIKVRLTPVSSNQFICYQVYVQDNGWQSKKACNGEVAGTTGQTRRIEAIKIWAGGIDYPGVCYQAHIQEIGWQPYPYCNEAIAGTTGQSRRLEAIQIFLSEFPPSSP